MRTRWMRGPWVGIPGLRRFAFACLAVFLALGTLGAGDPTVARSLLKTGKEYLERKKYGEAITHFQRARDEDPNLLEAVYWKAVGQERSGVTADSLASYREFLSLLEEKSSSGKPSAEEGKLKPLAERRVAALAAGEKEYQALEDAFAGDILKFTSARAEKEPALSRQALEMLLRVRPDHEAARKLYSDLGGKAPEIPAEEAMPPPFRAVKGWTDFLGRRSFETAVLAEVKDGHMVFDSKTADRLVPNSSTDPGSQFAYEMEFRLQEAYGSNWLSGLTFAEKEGGRSEDFVAVFVQSSAVVIFSASPGGKKELARKDISAIDKAGWHRFGFTVRDHLVEAWLDGRSCLTFKVPTDRDLRGVVGVYNQQCRSEWRLHRIGRL